MQRSEAFALGEVARTAPRRWRACASARRRSGAVSTASIARPWPSSRRAKSRAPTKSSPDGVRPGPSPSNGSAAACASVRVVVVDALARATSHAPSHGRAETPARVPRAARRAPAARRCRARRRQRDAAMRGARASRRRRAAIGALRQGTDRVHLQARRQWRRAASSTTARGCIAAWPSRERSARHRRGGRRSPQSPATSVQRPALRVSAACAFQPISRISAIMERSSFPRCRQARRTRGRAT